MNITAEAVKELISILGFIPAEGETNVFHKKYTRHNGYTLRVDFANKAIEYADTSFEDKARITIGSRSTSNFAKQENFVVLECVDRLLEKGYSPSSIELEKVYPSGKGHSGELDILVNDTSGQAFLMIECKTWGKEYTKEVEKMLASGGQLFTYFKNATSANFLCLYTSRLSENKIEYENSIVDVSEDWKSLSETKDIHERWNKVFKKDGIFQKNASPYNIVHKRLTYGDLVTMKDEDSRKIFHQIMTILRHNGVSDKPNAFNKLLNLFVCKIIDEDRSEDEELQFQCWGELTDEKLQMTLNDLYKEGMWRFLEIKIIDHSESDVDNVLQSLGINDNAHKQRLMEMFSDARLKKSPNFAFIEVQDEKTFKLNAKIVREVIELLQQYKFRYEQKHEFLGDFFEKMLNTSMKQEAGQFFTPVPITRFIISSLPIRDFIQKKIDEKEPDVLPTIIDYACGSGHFLTEYMSTMQDIIESVDVTKVSQRTIRNDLSSWRGDVKFKWAKDYVYGIDFDNRLVKTAKISAFFNGDGEATIIWGDGLDSFEHSEVYRGKLKETTINKQDNGQFDILISNPPYSVDSFRRMLKHGAESFDLYSGFTDNSSEIECLFIERMKQLLKVGGWAGIILPSSMLSNGGIYSRTRDIIFKYFNIKAIVELGSGTFMETGTNTVILFLERRPDSDHEKITKAINTFFTNKHDVTVSGIERAFSAFVANIYDDLGYEDYVSFVCENPSETMIEHELYKDYKKEFGDTFYAKALEVEKEKMLYFFLTYNQNTVVVKSGQKQDERTFLGYEFSKRRGHEGLRLSPNGTMLFDEAGDISNPQKVNSYIHNAFLGNSFVGIHETVANHVNYSRLSNLIEFGISRFGKRVNLRKQSKIVSPFPYKRLNDIVIVESGLWIGENPPLKNVGVIRGADFTLDGRLIRDNVAQINVDEKAFATRKLEYGDIVLEKSGGSSTQAVGRVIFFDIMDGEYSFSNFTARLRVTDNEVIPDYLYRFLHYFYSIGGTFSAQKDGKSQLKNLNMEEYLSIKIPIPPIDVQRQIVADFKAAVDEAESIRTNISTEQKNIDSKFFELFGDLTSNPKGFDVVKLGSLSSLVTKGASPTWQGFKYTNDSSQTLFVTSENVREGYMKLDPPKYIEDDFNEKQKRSMLEKGDFLINIVGASIGRAAQFNENCKANINQAVALVRLRENVINDVYLSYYLNSTVAIEMYSSMQVELARANLSLKNISDLRVVMPPVALQNSFAEFCNETHKSIANYQKALNESLRKRDEILLKYF